MRRLLSVAPVLLWLITPLAFAQLPGITSQPLPGGGQSWSLPVQTLVFITSLTFIPANFTDDDQFHPHHHCFWFIA